jgi:folate-binding protein YgfZ
MFDLTGRGATFVGGKDAVDFLHALVTNDVKKLRPGSGCDAALLTPKGKMVAYMTVLRLDSGLLLDTEPELAGNLAERLRGYVFYQDVAIEDRTAETAVLHLAGSDAVRALPIPAAPAAPHEHLEAEVFGRNARVAAEARTGAPGFDVRVAAADKEAVAAALIDAGAAPAPLAELESARVSAGIPRWGRELDESVLPNEAWLERNAISYNKGCYIGQEIVARIRTYGHVNRHLVRLELGTGLDVAPGAEVLAEGARVGAVTSATPGVALAFVRREHEAPGTRLAVATAEGPRDATVASAGVG